MTVPTPVPDPTEDELAQLRRLTTSDTDQLPDTEADRLLRAWRCDPLARTRYSPPAPGALYANRANHADVYAAAAEWWEAQATAALLANGDDAKVVTAERNGDVSVSYGGTKTRADQLRAQARRLRRQSCQKGARTVSVLPPDERAKLGQGTGASAVELDVFSAGDGLPDTLDTTPAYQEPRPAWGQADGVVNGPAL